MEQLRPLLKDATLFHDVFVGGGSIAIAVAKEFPKLQINVNDINPNISAFWRVIAGSADLQPLVEKVSIQPTLELFLKLRGREPWGLIEKAYYAIFFNRCTFSGIEKSGPIGGMKQESEYTVDCRYNKEKIIRSLYELRDLFRDRLTVSRLHFDRYFHTFGELGTFYLDPPYYEKGHQLYKHYMVKGEHTLLRNTLEGIDNWLLSYDNAPFIRELYSDYHILDLDVGYSIQGKKKNWNNKKEILITNESSISRRNK